MVWIGTVELRCPSKTYWSFILNVFVENSDKINMIIFSNISQSNYKHLFDQTNNNIENQRCSDKYIPLTSPIFGRKFCANDYGYWFGAYISTPDVHLETTCKQLCRCFMHTKLEHGISQEEQVLIHHWHDWTNFFKVVSQVKMRLLSQLKQNSEEKGCTVVYSCR